MCIVVYTCMAILLSEYNNIFSFTTMVVCAFEPEHLKPVFMATPRDARIQECHFRRTLQWPDGKLY